VTLAVRRGLLLLAALLTLAASAMPLWGFRMSAPQYPGESLHLRVDTGGIAGDVAEISTLQKYIGVRFPERLPELPLLPPALLVLAGTLAAAAAGGEGLRGRAARAGAGALMALFLAGAAVLLQLRLYAVGHDRDRSAPIRAVRDFTPPLLGPKKVGNFTVWSYPHFGGLALGGAGVLALLAARNGRRRAPASALVLACVALLSAHPAEGGTLTVGGPGADFPLIAPALAAAGEGDVVLVGPGVYREDLVITRAVRLRGRGWPVVMGTGEGTVIEVRAGGVEISGLAIEGSGTGESQRMDAGIAVLAGGNRITDNSMQRVFYGIVLAGAPDNVVTGNRIVGFTDLPYSRRGDGIYAYRSAGNRIAGNHVIGQRDGIYLQYAPRSRAEDNVVEGCRYGLHDMFSDGAAITGNLFRGSQAGANVMNSRAVAVYGNRFVGNRGVSAVGLSLKDCDESVAERNTVSDNATGVKIDGSSRNTFVGNWFAGNDRGVSLFASAEANVFTGNAFVRNGSDVLVRGRGSRTRWSQDGTGNYWDTYRGLDVDGDGRGETPHTVLGPFERLEGENPAARLFLRSPAAAALELAARVAPELREETSDPAPLARRPVPPAPPADAGSRPLGAALGVGAVVAIACRMEWRPCSR
jgi:nitrous oxidase accessory protein